MATRTPTITNLAPNQVDDGLIQVVWSGLLQGDDGAPVDFGAFPDRSVQVVGTFGAGGNVRIEGSNDGGANYAALTKPGATALDINAAGIAAVVELTGKIRPRVTAGDGTTNLTVTMVLRRGIR